MNKYFKKSISIPVRVLDVLLKITFELIALASLIVIRVLTCMRVRNSRKDVICVLKRYQDTIERHKASNTPEYLLTAFDRSPFRYTYVLCIGNGENRVERLSKNIIDIDILLIKFEVLSKIFPHLSVSMRDYVATIKTMMFMLKRRIGFVEVDFPNNLIIRSIRLKILLKFKLVTKVIGNIDLIYSQTKFPIFMPFQIKNSLGDVIHQIYDFAVSYIFFKSCDMVIGANKDNLDNAIGKGACPNKSYLVRIKVDRGMLDYPRLSREHLMNYPQEGRCILLWSRIAPEMMVDRTVRSLAPLLVENKDLNLVMIGTGSEVENIIQLGRDLGISSQLHLVGYQSRQYICSAAQYAQVVISPYGGSSLVEAGLLKCPVVAFDYEWQGELVIDGYTGLLADAKSHKDIEAKVREILSDSENAKKLGERLHSLTEKVFDPLKLDIKSKYVYGKLI